jgi:hypothetical protein
VLADNAITTAKVTDDAITTAKVADNAITLAKMAGGTDGQIITYDASGDPVAVGPGTDGQVLTSTGAGSPPAFEAVAAGGKILQTIHAQSATEVRTNSTTPQTLFSQSITLVANSKLFVALCVGQCVTEGGVNSGSIQINISVNGTNFRQEGNFLYSEPSWTRMPFASQMIVPASYLNTGSNTIILKAHSGTSGTYIRLNHQGSSSNTANGAKMVFMEIGA